MELINRVGYNFVVATYPGSYEIWHVLFAFAVISVVGLKYSRFEVRIGQKHWQRVSSCEYGLRRYESIRHVGLELNWRVEPVKC